jgi:hypothetical protein
LLAEVFLAKHLGGKIIHDLWLTGNTIEIIIHPGGMPVKSKPGMPSSKCDQYAERGPSREAKNNPSL